MIKTILKELIITILICVLILLVLSVLFYDYNPINKVVPNKVDKYETPENIQEEINENITELETTNIVYTVEGSDLNMYIKTNTYVQGKVNPFEVISDKVDGADNNNINNNGNTNGGSGSNGGTNVNNSTNTNFWNSTGTK